MTDPYEGFPSDRPMRKGFHPCYYLAARPHLASSAHIYEHTHTYTPYTPAYMRVGRCSSIWRIEQKTEGEANRDRGWRELINDHIQADNVFDFTSRGPSSSSSSSSSSLLSLASFAGRSPASALVNVYFSTPSIPMRLSLVPSIVMSYVCPSGR